MRFVDEFRDADKAHALAAKIAALCEPGRQYKFMEVCGGHTHTIYKHGLEDYLPEAVALVHGPGCPVCVIPMGRVDDAMALASDPDVIMTSFGDMMRVPGSQGSFFDAKAAGTDIRMVYSPLDSLKIARQNPDRQVVFMAIGFETTAPSTAMTMLRARAEGLTNFSVFCNHVTIHPAMKAILDSPDMRLDGFIGPGPDLTRIAASMRDAAAAAGVYIVTGDTKVVQRGKADGCYVNTAGVGLIGRDGALGVARAQPGDAIIVSGPIGDHGVTIMLARGELGIEADIGSDTAPLNGLVAALLDAVPGVRAMRDATRGGVATILNEIARAAQTGVLVREADIPVRPEVRGACELLGIDPMYVACEGRLVAVVPGDSAGLAVRALRGHPLGAEAAVIGEVAAGPPGIVQLKTAFGGTRIVDLLVGDPLPRIC